MAFESFIPGALDLTGDDAIIEGISYRRTLVLKKLVGSVLTPVNMTEYDAVAPTIVFKDKETENGGVITGCPVGVCVWTDSPGGAFQIDVTAANTNIGTGAASTQKFTGIVEITVAHDSEVEAPGSTPKKAMIYKGAWNVTKTAVAV